jgi:hypothetical protein
MMEGGQNGRAPREQKVVMSGIEDYKKYRNVGGPRGSEVQVMFAFEGQERYGVMRHIPVTVDFSKKLALEIAQLETAAHKESLKGGLPPEFTVSVSLWRWWETPPNAGEAGFGGKYTFTSREVEGR